METVRHLVMASALPISFVLLGAGHALLRLALRTDTQRLVLNLCQALFVAVLAFVWSGFDKAGWSLLSLALLYLAGNVLVTILLFVAGYVRLRRARGGRLQGER